MKLLFKLLAGFFSACALASLVAWGIVLTTLCESPRTPGPDTQHFIAYNCHGMTVYLSPLQDALRTWLIPVFITFGLLAGVAALFAIAKIRFDVQIRVRDASGKNHHLEVKRD